MPRRPAFRRSTDPLPDPSGAWVVVSVVAIILAIAISLVWVYTASTRSAALTTEPRGTPLHARGNRVLLVGDSLLWESQPQVTAALTAAGWNTAISAAPGTTIGVWSDKMAKMVRDADPDVVVVELGTNNCTAACPHLAAVIDRLMRSIPRSTPVYWLNVQSQPTYPAHPESVNDALAATRSRWSNISIVDMSARFRNHPEWHVSDGLHFTPAGCDQLGALITESLRASR